MMTDDRMALLELVEKAADADLVRDMLAFAAERIMDAEVETLTGAAKVEVLFAHLKRILGLRRFRLRGPCGVSDEVHLAAAAQNLRRLAKMLTGAPTPTLA